MLTGGCYQNPFGAGPFTGVPRMAGSRAAGIRVEWDDLNALVQLGHFTPPT